MYEHSERKKPRVEANSDTVDRDSTTIDSLLSNLVSDLASGGAHPYKGRRPTQKPELPEEGAKKPTAAGSGANNKEDNRQKPKGDNPALSAWQTHLSPAPSSQPGDGDTASRSCNGPYHRYSPADQAVAVQPEHSDKDPRSQPTHRSQQPFASEPTTFETVLSQLENDTPSQHPEPATEPEPEPVVLRGSHDVPDVFRHGSDRSEPAIAGNNVAAGNAEEISRRFEIIAKRLETVLANQQAPAPAVSTAGMEAKLDELSLKFDRALQARANPQDFVNIEKKLDAIGRKFEQSSVDSSRIEAIEQHLSQLNALVRQSREHAGKLAMEAAESAAERLSKNVHGQNIDIVEKAAAKAANDAITATLIDTASPAVKMERVIGGMQINLDNINAKLDAIPEQLRFVAEQKIHTAPPPPPPQQPQLEQVERQFSHTERRMESIEQGIQSLLEQRDNSDTAFSDHNHAAANLPPVPPATEGRMFGRRATDRARPKPASNPPAERFPDTAMPPRELLNEEKTEPAPVSTVNVDEAVARESSTQASVPVVGRRKTSGMLVAILIGMFAVLGLTLKSNVNLYEKIAAMLPTKISLKFNGNDHIAIAESSHAGEGKQGVAVARPYNDGKDTYKAAGTDNTDIRSPYVVAVPNYVMEGDAPPPMPKPEPASLKRPERFMEDKRITHAEDKDIPPASIGPSSVRNAAAGGDPAAQLEVAMRYMQSPQIENNEKEAAKWFTKAAMQGVAVAQYRLGTIYERGMGAARDMARAEIWYRRAAEQGNIKSMHNLAVISANPADGTRPDYITAVEWFAKAADLGLTDSQFNLAVLYYNGLGVEKDDLIAYKYFALAAAGGDEEAAKKRNEIEGRLDPAFLQKAKEVVKSWKQEPMIKSANEVERKRDFTNISRVTAPMVARAQQLLAELGYDPGTADGILGEQTKVAVREFERRSGLDETGEVNSELVAKLESLAIPDMPGDKADTTTDATATAEEVASPE
jgi:hypothetical protein